MVPRFQVVPIGMTFLFCKGELDMDINVQEIIAQINSVNDLNQLNELKALL